MEQKYSRLTLEDIAKEIHISRTTIYKVINNKGTVSPRTREIIMNALEKYHYVPNNNARNLALNKKYDIAFFDFESPDAKYFAPMIRLGIDQAVRDYGDHGLTVHHYTSPVSRPQRQLADLEKAFRLGIRHFIIAAASTGLMEPAVARLKSEGCHIITLSKDIGSACCDSFIGIDNYKSGRLAAELLGKMQQGRGAIQILMARESSSNLISMRENSQGFLDQMRDCYPGIRLLPSVEGIEDTRTLENALSNVLKNEEITGIYDLTYRLDTICKFLSRKKQKHISLVGLDLFPEIEPYITDRTVDAVIFQNLKAQAHLACRLLFEKMCYGKDISGQKHYAKPEIVMAGNLEYFLNFEEI